MYGRNRREEEDDNESGIYAEPKKSWLSTETNLSLSPRRQPGPAPSSDVDRVLFNDLVQIVPLVQSLIDRKGSRSFTRTGSMIYTKTPSRDSRKNDAKCRNGAKPTLGNKHSDKEQSKQSKNAADDYSVVSANMAAENDKELNSLKEQLEDLRQQVLEKDELLKAAAISKNQLHSVQSQVDEMKHFATAKDSLIKTSQQQLNDAKIKLADRQAALEKLQWEARTSNQKVESLQKELDSMQSQISSLMIVFEGLSNDDSIKPTEDYDISPHYADHLLDVDDLDETEMQKMEEARIAYIEALALAKEKQNEESLAAAAKARLHLQSFVFRSNDE